MLIKITTFKLDNGNVGEVISEMHCNLLKPEKQEWLLKHLIWASAEKHGVQIINNDTSEDETDISKQSAYEAGRAAWRAERELPTSGGRGTHKNKSEKSY